MSNLEVKIKKLNSEAKLPSYGHLGDAGFDVYSMEEKVLAPGERYIFSVGFALEFPEGFVAIVKDKSSTSKAGLHTMGGVFDAGYRGEYNVQLINLSSKSYTVEQGDKIAQILIMPVERAEFIETDELSDSSRGGGRFGSTGRK